MAAACRLAPIFSERPPGRLRYRRHRRHDRREDRQPLPGLGAVALQAGHYVGRRSSSCSPASRLSRSSISTRADGPGRSRCGGGRAASGGDDDRPLGLARLVGRASVLLNGAEEKAGLFVDWGWNMLTHERGKRIIFTDGGCSVGAARAAKRLGNLGVQITDPIPLHSSINRLPSAGTRQCATTIRCAKDRSRGRVLPARRPEGSERGSRVRLLARVRAVSGRT